MFRCHSNNGGTWGVVSTCLNNRRTHNTLTTLGKYILATGGSWFDHGKLGWGTCNCAQQTLQLQIMSQNRIRVQFKFTTDYSGHVMSQYTLSFNKHRIQRQ